MTGIAINCSREYLRKAKRVRSYELIEAVDLRRASKIRQEIDLIDLDRAVSTLPDGYREVLILHDMEGYTHDEIAAFLEIASGTSKGQLSRARTAVRTFLQEKEQVSR